MIIVSNDKLKIVKLYLGRWGTWIDSDFWHTRMFSIILLSKIPRIFVKVHTYLAFSFVRSTFQILTLSSHLLKWKLRIRHSTTLRIKKKYMAAMKAFFRPHFSGDVTTRPARRRDISFHHWFGSTCTTEVTNTIEAIAKRINCRHFSIKSTYFLHLTAKYPNWCHHHRITQWKKSKQKCNVGKPQRLKSMFLKFFLT